VRRFLFPVLPILLSSLSWQAALSQSPASAQPLNTSPTLHVYSRLVLLDVTVTDARGVPIRGLSRSAFQVLDNNRPQKIASFEEHTADPKIRYAGETTKPGTYSNDVMIHPPPVFNLILIDTNTIDMPEQMYLYDQLNRFIGELPANQPIAIYHRWGDYTMLAQDFTTDHQLLLKAVRKAIPRLPIPGASTYSDLDTLKQILAYIGSIPGRKNVLWFTGGSNLFLEPKPTGDNLNGPSALEIQFSDELREIYDQLEADRVSLYPIDARGLVYAPPKLVGHEVNQDAITGLFNQHSLMSDIAAATGGRAYYNNNGLSQITSEVISQDGSYYTLTYTPNDLHLDNKWHKLKVKLNNSSYELSYRHGYFDDGVNDASTPAKRDSRTLLRSGGSTERVPDTHDEPIIFQAQVLPAADLPPPMVGQKPNPPDRVPKRGEVAYTIHYTVPLNAFHQKPVGAQQTFKVGAAIMAFDQYGKRVGWFSQTLSLSLDKQSAGQQSRIGFDQSINLLKGNGNLYLVIWDPSTGRVGGLEVPVEVQTSKR
jgi:VWFA-related protein